MCSPVLAADVSATGSKLTITDVSYGDERAVTSTGKASSVSSVTYTLDGKSYTKKAEGGKSADAGCRWPAGRSYSRKQLWCRRWLVTSQKPKFTKWWSECSTMEWPGCSKIYLQLPTGITCKWWKSCRGRICSGCDFRWLFRYRGKQCNRKIKTVHILMVFT